MYIGGFEKFKTMVRHILNFKFFLLKIIKILKNISSLEFSTNFYYEVAIVVGPMTQAILFHNYEKVIAFMFFQIFMTASQGRIRYGAQETLKMLF